MYSIDWKNPQIEANTLTGGFDFVTNGNTARSRGVETELTVPLAVSTQPGLEHNRADFVGRPRTIGLELNYSFKDH